VRAQRGLRAAAPTIGPLFTVSSTGGAAGAAVAPALKARLRFGQIVIGTTALRTLGALILAIEDRGTHER
jgi:hypothetical protein